MPTIRKHFYLFSTIYPSLPMATTTPRIFKSLQPQSTSKHNRCVLDRLTTMNKFGAPPIIRYSMPMHEKQQNKTLSNFPFAVP